MKTTQTLPALLAELERVPPPIYSGTRRVTQKVLARILRCNVATVRDWFERLGCNLPAPHSDQAHHPDRFLIESWFHCSARRVTPYGKTKAVANKLGLYPDTVTRVAKRLNLVPIRLHHPILRFLIHFWTRAQVNAIAARTGRLQNLTTTKHFAPQSCGATAQKPSAGRSRRRPAQNFLPHETDDIAS